MTHYQELLKAIEDGVDVDMMHASRGDIAYAMHVHNKLLPGHKWIITDKVCGYYDAEVSDGHGKWEPGRATTPGRAWLIAILKVVVKNER